MEGVDLGDGAAVTLRSCEVLRNGGDGICVHGEDCVCIVLESKAIVAHKLSECFLGVKQQCQRIIWVERFHCHHS